MPDEEMRDAAPDRYLVQRRGTPDPATSRYYVLDVMHDREAREVLRLLVRKYRYFGPSSKADDLERLLDQTDAPFGEMVKRRAEALRPKLKGRAAAIVKSVMS